MPFPFHFLLVFSQVKCNRTGIGPEAFAYISNDGNFTSGDPITDAQLAYYKKHGYYITTSYYVLRPEVLESNFIAWRVTGDEKYYKRAQDVVESFNKYLKVDEGYAGLYDVNDVNSDKYDDMESFWFAEVLKYLFLTFDDPNNINIDECKSPLFFFPAQVLKLGS